MGELEEKLRQIAGSPVDLSTVEAGGKVIKLRNPLASNRILANELADGSAALVPPFEAMLCVVSINGDAQARPTSRSRMDVLADRLGLEAMEAVTLWYRDKTFPELKEAIEELGEDGTMQDAMMLAVKKRREKSKN